MAQSLEEAAKTGDINGLYDSIKEDPNVLDRIDAIPFVHTPLHVAVSAGHADFAIEILRLLPSLGRKLNPKGESSLHLALINKKFDTVKRLIKFDKEIIRVKGREGITPLHFIAQKDINGDQQRTDDSINAEQQQREEDPRLNILAEFLFACPDSIEDLTIRNETALHIAVKTKNQGAVEVILGCIRRMNKKRVLANKDQEGNTALHIAVSHTQLEMVKLLVTGFLAYTNETNSEGRTARDIALSLGTDEAAINIRSSLSGAGALESSSLDYSLARFLNSLEPPLDLNVALTVAAEKGDINGLYGLIERAPRVLDDIDGIPFVDTPLHTAASAGHTDFAIEILRLMPSFGRKLNPRGESSLHLALINKKFETVKWLIEFDKELIRAKGRERTTPLHVLVNNDIYGHQADEEHRVTDEQQRVTDEQERVADDCINIWFEFVFDWRNSIEDLTIRDDPINADQQQRGTDEQQRALPNIEQERVADDRINILADRDDPINANQQQRGTDEQQRVADEEQRVTDEQERVADDRINIWFEFVFDWRNSIEDLTIRDDPINADQQQRGTDEQQRALPNIEQERVADDRINILADRDDPINADQQQRGTDEQQRALPNIEQERVATEQERLADDRINILAEFLFACPNSVEDLTIQDETALHIAVKSKNQKAVAIILGCICRIDRRSVLDYKDKEGNTALCLAVSTSQDKIVSSLRSAGAASGRLTQIVSSLRSLRASESSSPEPSLAEFLNSPEEPLEVFFKINIGLVVVMLIATQLFEFKSQLNRALMDLRTRNMASATIVGAAFWILLGFFLATINSVFSDHKREGINLVTNESYVNLTVWSPISLLVANTSKNTVPVPSSAAQILLKFKYPEIMLFVMPVIVYLQIAFSFLLKYPEIMMFVMPVIVYLQIASSFLLDIVYWAELVFLVLILLIIPGSLLLKARDIFLGMAVEVIARWYGYWIFMVASSCGLLVYFGRFVPSIIEAHYEGSMIISLFPNLRRKRLLMLERLTTNARGQ